MGDEEKEVIQNLILFTLTCLQELNTLGCTDVELMEQGVQIIESLKELSNA